MLSLFFIFFYFCLIRILRNEEFTLIPFDHLDCTLTAKVYNYFQFLPSTFVGQIEIPLKLYANNLANSEIWAKLLDKPNGKQVPRSNPPLYQKFSGKGKNVISGQIHLTIRSEALKPQKIFEKQLNPKEAGNFGNAHLPLLIILIVESWQRMRIQCMYNVLVEVMSPKSVKKRPNKVRMLAITPTEFYLIKYFGFNPSVSYHSNQKII